MYSTLNKEIIIFYKFLQNISRGEKDRFDYLCQPIGILLNNIKIRGGCKQIEKPSISCEILSNSISVYIQVEILGIS